MKIELSPKQYQTLLELVYLGNWMINSYRENTIAKYDDLEQQLFSMAKEFDLADLADDEGYPTLKFEEETPVHDFTGEYDDNLFWDELPHRLAVRDLHQKYSKTELKRLSDEQIYKELGDLTEKYTAVFDQSGLDTLTLK